MTDLYITPIPVILTQANWTALLSSIFPACQRQGMGPLSWHEWLSYGTATVCLPDTLLAVTLNRYSWQQILAIFDQISAEQSPEWQQWMIAISQDIQAGLRKSKSTPAPDVAASTVAKLPAVELIIKVAGVTFEGRQEVLRQLKVGESLYLRREPDNVHDYHAIRIKRLTGQEVGVVERNLAAKLAPVFDAYGLAVPATVFGLQGGNERYPNLGVRIKFALPTPPLVEEESPRQQHYLDKITRLFSLFKAN